MGPGSMQVYLNPNIAARFSVPLCWVQRPFYFWLSFYNHYCLLQFSFGVGDGRLAFSAVLRGGTREAISVAPCGATSTSTDPEPRKVYFTCPKPFFFFPLLLPHQRHMCIYTLICSKVQKGWADNKGPQANGSHPIKPLAS